MTKFVTRDWVWAANAEEKCLDAAYFAKNQKFKELWYSIAEKIEEKYLTGQPWLRTYDGEL